MNPNDFLEQIYEECMTIVGKSNTVNTRLSKDETALLDAILERSESSKGVLTVVITSLVYKCLNPNQDVRNHQDSIKDGYSGRTFDTKYITPFLKRNNFPAMAESGWLTRSLEQKQPYTKNYSGAITPPALKVAFLGIMELIQSNNNSRQYLNYIIQILILKRNSQVIDLAKPTNLSIHAILDLLRKHFYYDYKAEGASRLPVLAIYAIYQCLIHEAKRFNGMTLLPIESHTSADKRSGRIGDIEIFDSKNRSFEAVEVKYEIPITLQIVQDAYSKFKTTPVNRYYILSTARQVDSTELKHIHEEISKIRTIHGCQVIINGIMPSLNYYLRLLEDAYEFIDKYVELIEIDSALKFEHKEAWNDIISSL